MQATQMRRIILAGIVGDALGVPVEFKERDSYHMTHMRSYGTWNQPLGSWSDDTAMSLALMANLTVDGDYTALFEKFQDFMMDGEYMPQHETFDIGQTCVHAIRNWGINHITPTECGDASEFANGNGALMRLAPLALVLATESNQAQLLQLTRDYTTMTHRHPRAILGSYLYLEILHGLFNGESLASAIANLTFSLKPALTPDILAEWPAYEPFLRPSFGQTSRDKIKSTGYVVDTFGAALWSVTQAQSLKEAILIAANLGGDTDTVGTITATLAASRFPTDLVPWVDDLMQPVYLAGLIDPFVAKFATNN